MADGKSYPQEMFDLRLKRYRSKKRTKLPHQLELEICERVNRLAKKDNKKAGFFLITRPKEKS
jgi:hypothetical protein